MKHSNIITSFAFLFTLAFVSDAYSQGRPSSGRTSSRTGSSSSSSGSSSSGSSYSGGSSSSGSSYSGGSSRSSGSSYSGGSSSSGSSSNYGGGYTYTPSPARRAAPSNRRTAPPVSNRAPHEPIRNGQVRNVGNYTGGSYTPAQHRPTTYERVPTRIRYQHARDYHQNVNHSYVYVNWILVPAPYRYNDGYCYYDDYDWYVYQGYRYRYNDEDRCHYDLIDTRTNTVVKEFKDMSCKDAYDSCAAARDALASKPDYYDLKDYYICAERTQKDLANEQATSLPSPTSALKAETVTALSNFVASKSLAQLYKVGKKGLNKCKIAKAPKNSNRCNYMVMVDGKPYPDAKGNVCSNRDTSRAYGCSTSSQKSNAGCLLSLAIMEGQCLDEQESL